MKKYAVLSLDVEDWHHLDYFSSTQVNKEYSMLDGVNNFLEIVESHGISSTLFTLSDVAPLVKNELIQAVKNNHEVSSHGLSHKRPLTLKIFFIAIICPVLANFSAESIVFIVIAFGINSYVSKSFSNTSCASF